MSPITRSKTSPRRWLNPVFPTLAELEDAFLFAVSRVQQDAQQLLGVELTVPEIKQNLYNSQSQEFWLVNNSDALREVMYYKMKKNLFTKYKDQLIAAGIEVTKKVDSMKLLIKTIIDDNSNNDIHNPIGFGSDRYQNNNNNNNNNNFIDLQVSALITANDNDYYNDSNSD